MKMRLILLPLMALCAAAYPVFAGGAAAAAKNTDSLKKTDSLKTLDVLLSAEMKTGNRVLHLKDGKLADSLMRGGTGFRREGLESILGDSTVATEFRNREEFRLYWARVQESNGFGALKRQHEIQDIDKSLIPKIYLFDSACVVFPGWVVLRKKR